MSELVINKRKSDKASIQSRESVHISYSITLHCIADNSAPKDSASHKKKDSDIFEDQQNNYPISYAITYSLVI